MTARRVAAWSLGSGLALACVAAGPRAEGARGAFHARTLAIGADTVAYAVWTPPGFDRARTWPAILFLHGTGESGSDRTAMTRIGLGPALERDPARWPFVVVFPQKRTAEEEWWEREREVLAVLDAARAEFAVDPARIALTGMSQGGHGAWMLGARHPERWSCLVPVCGYGRARTVAGRAASLPVWAFHGLRDDVVWPEDTRQITAALRDERARRGLDTTAASLRVTLPPEANHGVWDLAYATEALPDWILSQRRAEAEP